MNSSWFERDSKYSNNTSTKIGQWDIEVWEWLCRTVALPALNVLYVIVFYIFVKYKAEFSGSYYALVKSLALSDLFESLYESHLFFLYKVTGDKYYFGYVFGKLFRLIALVFCWYFNVAIHLFIGINRYFAIVFFSRYKTWFNWKTTGALILTAVLYGVATCVPYFVICGLEVKPNTTYNPTTYLMSCDPLISEIYERLDIIGVFSMVGVLGVLSVVSVVMSVHRLKTLAGSKAIYVKEIKLMIQGLILVGFLVIIVIVYYVPPLNFLSNILTAFYSTTNPLVYLILDKKLQTRFVHVLRKMLHIFNGSTVQPVTVVNPTAYHSSKFQH